MLDQLRLAMQRRLERLTGQSTAHLAPATDPAHANALRTKGNDLLAEGKLNEAETCFREALVHNADDTRTIVCLGYVLKEQGRLTEARIILKRAAHPGNTDPEVFEALYLLGEISEMQTEFADAMKYFAATLDVKPDFTRACEDIIRILRHQGRKGEIRALLENMTRIYPASSEYHLMLAKACTDLFDYQGTIEHLVQAVSMGATDKHINFMIGAALCQLEREEESRRYFDMAISADPSIAHEALYHRGYAHTRSGNLNAAVELLESSIALRPDFIPSHSQLLLTLSYAAPTLNRSYQMAAQRFAKSVEDLTQPLSALPMESEQLESTVLRIGFIAGEFREHPVFHFLVGVLRQIDRTRFHLVAFSNNQSDDSATTVFRELFSQWFNIKEMSHDSVADLVRKERIDVLFDLSGHSGDSRLLVFARKPAPVQVTWLGYFASTGLKAMDYILADTICAPEDTPEWFSEKIVRLPKTRLCMTTPRTSRPIPVAQAPCQTKGHITFGSFQQITKINGQVLRTWATILASVPQSRLRVQNKAIDSALIAAKIQADMKLAGIDLERVEFVGAKGWEEYLEAHREVDIVLDTFPYPGGTTTAFALWMGVPTVTLSGKTMLSLQGASMLECVGLSDWIATNEADYIDIARRFACAPGAITLLREQLRTRTENSPLFDCKNFAGNLENAIRFMYQEKAAAPLHQHTSRLVTE